MSTVVQTNINVQKLSNGTIEVRMVPPVARVPNNDGVADAQLVWNLTGATFVEPQFRWKTTGQLPNVTPSATTLTSAVYTKNTSTSTEMWEYEFTIRVNGEATTILIDPEVENLPPGQP